MKTVHRGPSGKNGAMLAIDSDVVYALAEAVRRVIRAVRDPRAKLRKRHLGPGGFSISLNSNLSVHVMFVPTAVVDFRADNAKQKTVLFLISVQPGPSGSPGRLR